MTTRQRTADGLVIRYAEAEEGGNETVLLLNPWPESLFAWDTIWSRLAQTARLVAIDLPGFGNRLGAIAYLLLAVPLGLLRGRGTVYISLELASQGLVASTCAAIARRRYVGFSFSSGRRGEIEHFRASRLWPLRRALLRRASRLVSASSKSASSVQPCTFRCI